MEIYGKVHYVDKKERLFSIIVKGTLQYFHLTNKNMKDFKSYLFLHLVHVFLLEHSSQLGKLYSQK